MYINLNIEILHIKVNSLPICTLSSLQMACSKQERQLHVPGTGITGMSVAFIMFLPNIF